MGGDFRSCGFYMMIGDSICGRSRTLDRRPTCPVSASDTPDFSDVACFLHGGAAFDCSCLPTFVSPYLLFKEGGTASRLCLRHAYLLRFLSCGAGSNCRRAESSTSQKLAHRVLESWLLGGVWGE